MDPTVALSLPLLRKAFFVAFLNEAYLGAAACIKAGLQFSVQQLLVNVCAAVDASVGKDHSVFGSVPLL